MGQFLMSDGFSAGLKSSGPVVFFPVFVIIIIIFGWDALLDLLNYIFYSSDILTIGDDHLKDSL